MYRNGQYSDKRGIKYNYQQAFFWYKKAAEQDLVEAQVNLGELYKNGKGVKTDYEQALIWFRKSASAGDIKAQLNLGEMYKNGKGVVRDNVEALKWFIISSESGNAISRMHRDYIAKKMTHAETESAKRLAIAWLENHQL